LLYAGAWVAMAHIGSIFVDEFYLVKVTLILDCVTFSYHKAANQPALSFEFWWCGHARHPNHPQ
jgi:hypothetical protein